MINGSSPHTRGTHYSLAYRRHAPRLIPAHAGNTPPERWRPRPGPAHPRTRGEHGGDLGKLLKESGSSPHTRGTLLRRRQPDARGRLIPAHAGNTRPRGVAGVAPAAHPRTRGEHHELPEAEGRQAGSSPHTRGTQLRSMPPRRRDRLIPAHAGNTASTAVTKQSPTAHPRTRGEHIGALTGDRTLTGSSPHTRGTPLRPPVARLGTRLIPAHAGNTASTSRHAPSVPAHPRTRGEHWRASLPPTA